MPVNGAVHRQSSKGDSVRRPRSGASEWGSLEAFLYWG